MATMPVHHTTRGERELMRDANERAWGLADGESIDFRCEFGSVACPEVARLSRLSYERIRGSWARFIVVPGHERPGSERVTEVSERYAVVESTAAGNATP